MIKEQQQQQQQAARVIQRAFYYRRFIENINKIRDIDNIRLLPKDKLTEDFSEAEFETKNAFVSFHDMRKTMINKENIQVFQKCLDYFNRFVKTLKSFQPNLNFDTSETSPKELFSAFMIYYFPETLVTNTQNKEKRELENSVFILSKKLLYYITKHVYKPSSDDYMCVIKRFSKYLDLYKKDYNSWKEFDRKEMITSMSNMFWDLEIMFYSHEYQTDEEKEEWFEKKEKKQAEIYKRIKQFGGEEQFQAYAPVVVDGQFRDMIEENLKKAYWDVFEKSLLEKPTNYEFFGKFIEDIKEKVQTLMPKRTDIIEELSLKVNVEDLNKTKEEEIISTKVLIPIFEYLNALLMQMDAVEQETSHELWFHGFRNFIKDEDDNELIAQKIVEFFKRFMEKIDSISEEVSKFKGTELYKDILKRKV